MNNKEKQILKTLFRLYYSYILNNDDESLLRHYKGSHFEEVINDYDEFKAFVVFTVESKFKNL